jgi:L-threonylcarbamoyladenylate synthase
MAPVRVLNPYEPDREDIHEAIRVLKQGGLVVYPTETFYALGADVLNEGALASLFATKGRGFHQPIALIGGSEEDVRLIAEAISEEARRLMTAFWPGPLTLLFAASHAVSPRLTAGTGKIGIRISSHPVARALARTLGRPLTATSANLSGTGACNTVAEVMDQLGRHSLLFLDGGRTPGGMGSTILDVTVKPARMVRAGAIDRSTIEPIVPLAPDEIQDRA